MPIILHVTPMRTKYIKTKGIIWLLCCLIVITTSCRKEEDLTVASQSDLEEKLNAEVSQQDLSSIAYCVVKKDELLLSGAIGFADKSRNILATDSTRYLIASISKVITGIAVLKLVDENKISLDDDIQNHLPFSVRNPDFPNEKITYRMLLSHTSGISDTHYENIDLDCYGIDCPMSLASFFENIFLPAGMYYSANHFSKHKPGSHEEYSNLASALLGYLVERIAQTPFDVFCKHQIFEPLGMMHTEWRLASIPISQLAIPYSQDIKNENPHYIFPDYPNGGLRTSVLDLSRFLRMLMQEGNFKGTQLISGQAIAEMKTLQMGSANQCLSLYYEIVHGKSVLGHSGGEKGVTTEMFWDPQTQVGVIVFNNDDDAELDNILKILFNFGEKE